MSHSAISLGLGLGGGKSATSSGAPSGGGGGFPNEYSVEFDAVDDYCGVGSNPGLDVYAQSLWFKPDSTITYNSGFGLLSGGWGYGGSTYGGIRFSIGVTGRVLEFNDGFQYIAAGGITSINTDWHHLLVNYVASGYETTDGTASNSGKGYEIWLDGNRVDTALGSTSWNFTLGTTSAKLKLAREGERAAYYFGGLIDEFAIFGSSLSHSDIGDIYNSGTPTDLTDYSPTMWWRMGDNDGGTGTTITDQGSGGNNGTLTNGPTFSATVP